MNEMSCDAVRGVMELLLDDELSMDLVQPAVSHIDQCLECQGEWQDMLFLREVFRDLSRGILVDSKADLALISERLESVAPRRCSKKVLVFPAAACAAIIALGVPLLLGPGNNAKVPWRLEVISSNFETSAGYGHGLDLKEVQKHVDFDIRALAIPGYRLTAAEVLHVPDRKSACLAKLTYRSIDALEHSDIVCYQACKGQIDTSMLDQAPSLSGTLISCGQVRGVSMIYWPDGVRDNLLVSSISERALKDLAMRLTDSRG